MCGMEDVNINVLNVTGYKIYNSSVIKGDGCYITDNSGKKYIDFEAGVWALPLGHNSAPVNNAIIKQLSEISHTGYRYTHPIVEETAGILLQITESRRGVTMKLVISVRTSEKGLNRKSEFDISYKLT